ncbi:hypothetical protein R1sor_007347 [Riccia sorocarpa]|uniref:Endonuclease/exonuclease/phosphatase domain-containing protein n=1 Tax=Riccia sorocarpa TaxID=122646 RepID=A0ABD3HSE4_9MARC
MCWNVRGWNEKVLKGGSDTWESVDIIALVETWEWQGQNGLDIPGFSRVQTIFNSKRHSQGRGFGGIIIWARDGIGVNIQVELTDPDNQFICLRLSDEDPSFFIIAYFAPVGAPAEKLPEVGSLPWSQLEELHDESRRSDDVVVNRMGEYFLQFASVCGLSVLNGTHQFPDTHGFTFTSPGGSSVIDYMLVSDTAWRRVSSFRLGPFVPESDHCPLFCEISGFRTRRRMRRVLVDRGWSTWNAASKTRYAELVNAKLQEDHSDNMVKISEFLVSMAGKVRHKSKDQPWFTSECSQARQKAISSPPEVKHEEFRAYKNLIKAKRREFVRKQQLLLAEELSREPRLFWTRLKTKQKGSELGDQELLGYVGRLYSFNDVEVMPYPEGPTCLFSVQEVTFAVNKLSTGKAADLQGLTVEMLKWGGPGLLKYVTALLNTACLHGFPSVWSSRKVVPLHKSGPRSDPNNYRTIMIGSVFAKLFGKLVELRLTEWCEQRQMRLPAQAGFRRSFSTLDHALVLRVLQEEAKRNRGTLFITRGLYGVSFLPVKLHPFRTT